MDELVKVLSLILTKEREDIGRLLVYIFEAYGLEEFLLVSLLKNEVQAADDINTLFRANSMASKVFFDYNQGS